MTGLVFLHGWGFGPGAWQAWAEAFTDRPILLLDAGYFGPARLAVPDNADGWIGVGHSLGFAQLLNMGVPWRGLIGFGAFLRFCQSPGNTGGTPAETLDAMIERLHVDPADVLRRFARRCGLREPPPHAHHDLSRLAEDLRLLRDLHMAAPALSRPGLLLHAADDRIVSRPLAEDAATRLGARLHAFETGGHALPFTRLADCLPMVREFLHGLD